MYFYSNFTISDLRKKKYFKVKIFDHTLHNTQFNWRKTFTSFSTLPSPYIFLNLVHMYLWPKDENTRSRSDENVI